MAVERAFRPDPVPRDLSVQLATERLDQLAEQYPETELAYPTGYAEAVLGVIEEMNHEPRLLLSKKQMVEIYVRDNDFEKDDDPLTVAIDDLQFNTWGAYVKNGPLYLEDL